MFCLRFSTSCRRTKRKKKGREPRSVSRSCAFFGFVFIAELYQTARAPVRAGETSPSIGQSASVFPLCNCQRTVPRPVSVDAPPANHESLGYRISYNCKGTIEREFVPVIICARRGSKGRGGGKGIKYITNKTLARAIGSGKKQTI
jgi:hypothetical protein